MFNFFFFFGQGEGYGLVRIRYGSISNNLCSTFNTQTLVRFFKLQEFDPPVSNLCASVRSWKGAWSETHPRTWRARARPNVIRVRPAELIIITECSYSESTSRAHASLTASRADRNNRIKIKAAESGGGSGNRSYCAGRGVERSCLRRVKMRTLVHQRRKGIAASSYRLGTSVFMHLF